MLRTDVYVNVFRDADDPALWRAQVRLVNPDKPTDDDSGWTLNETHKSRNKAMERAGLYVNTANMVMIVPGMRMRYFENIAPDDRSRWRKLCDAFNSMLV